MAIHNAPAPNKGPNVNPKPNAAPINAMPRVRRWAGVTSAMYAWAVGIVAPVMPAPIREMNIHVRLPACVAIPNNK